SPVVAIASGHGASPEDAQSLAATADGTIWAWGDNDWGQVGDGTYGSDDLMPVRTVMSSVDEVPPDQGNVLRAVRSGSDVLLEFAGARAGSWRVYRDATKFSLGVTPVAPDAVTPLFLDVGEAASGSSWLYRVKGLSPCTGRPGP